MVVDPLTLTPNELLFQFVLPFILIYTLFWAILLKLGIFDKKVTMVISLVVAIMISSSPIFFQITTVIAQLSTFTVVLLFAFVFIGGAAMWADRETKRLSPARKKKDLLKERKEVYKKYKKLTAAGRDDEARQVWERVKAIDEEIDRLEKTYS